MKKIFVAAILLCVSYLALPQTKTGLKTTTLPFCATDGHVPDALLKIGHSELLAQATTASCYYMVRVYFHIVRNTNGTGGQNVAVIQTIMTNLTTVYNPWKIYIVNGGNDEIRNDFYMSNFDNNKFTSLIGVNVASNAINIYLLDDLTYNAGKANGIPGTALVVGGAYTTPEGTVQNLVPSLVVPHEVGHCLGLFHTFETANGLELVNESNCSTAGDLVCDTPADSPNYNFKENNLCQWTVTFNDSNGTPFNPDPHNIMTYVRPSCFQYFTSGQGSRMIAMIGSLPNVIIPATISGPNPLCNAGTFTLQNQPPGFTVTWSTSNASVLSINPNSGAATQQNHNTGQVTVTATMVNGTCSATANYSTIVGSPAPSYIAIDNTSCPEYYFSTNSVPTATSYLWQYNILPSGPITSFTTIVPQTGRRVLNSGYSYRIGVQANCTCGPSYFTTTQFTVNCPHGPLVTASPNPVANILNVQLTPSINTGPLGAYSTETAIESVVLKDGQGNTVAESHDRSSKINLSIPFVPKGTYYLFVMVGAQEDVQRIIVDR